MNIIQRFEHGVAVLALRGNPLCEPDVAALRRIITSLVNSGMKRVIIDFSRVSHINSMGLGGLINAKKNLEVNGGEVKLTGINASVQKVLRRTNLIKMFPTFPTVDQALEHYSC